jgi:hypothetical protein
MIGIDVLQLMQRWADDMTESPPSPSMPRSFDIAEPTRDPRTLTLMISLVSLAGIMIFLYTVVRPSPPPFIVPVLLVVLVVQNVAISRLIKRQEVTLDGETLQVQAGMSRRSIAAAEMDLVHARVLRLDEHPEWKPFLRTNGVGLPGLSLGWFRSRQLVRLFCLLTDRERVLVLPLRGKKEAVLLSLKRPDELLSALRTADDARQQRR